MSYLLYLMIGAQLLAWGWHQWKAGRLTDRNYMVFCGMMMLGQLAAGVECLQKRTWGTLVVQVYFFAWTLVGAIQRYRHRNTP